VLLADTFACGARFGGSSSATETRHTETDRTTNAHFQDRKRHEFRIILSMVEVFGGCKRSTSLPFHHTNWRRAFVSWKMTFSQDRPPLKQADEPRRAHFVIASPSSTRRNSMADREVDPVRTRPPPGGCFDLVRWRQVSGDARRTRHARAIPMACCSPIMGLSCLIPRTCSLGFDARSFQRGKCTCPRFSVRRILNEGRNDV